MAVLLRALRLLLVPFGAIFSLSIVRAAEVDQQAAFKKTVLPVLRKFCGDCHAEDTCEDRWSFDGYRRFPDLVGDQKAWHKVEQFVSLHIMPPVDATAPAEADRRTILRWIDETVFYVDPNRPDPGRPTLRRLNRAEYNNSLRDVFGVDERPADRFPADDSGYGFDNIGDVLSLSPLLLEKYLSSAREVAQEATRLGPPARVGVEVHGDKLEVFSGKPDQREFVAGRQQERKEKVFLLHSPADEVGVSVRIPATSIYRVVSQAAVGLDAEKHLAKLEYLCDGKPVATVEPQAEFKDAWGRIPFTPVLLDLPGGEHKIGVRLKPSDTEPVNDAKEKPEQEKPQQGKDEKQPTGPLAAVGLLAVNGPYAPTPPEAPPFLRPAAAKAELATPMLRLSGEDLDPGTGNTTLDTGRALYKGNGYRHILLKFPKTGHYRIRYKVGAQQVGDEKVKFEGHLDKQTIGSFTITAEAQREQWFEQTVEIAAGEQDWQVWFVNEFTDPESKAERHFWLHEVTIEGPLEDTVGLKRDDALALLSNAGRRLFRRPITDEESAKLAKLFDAAVAAGETPLDSVQFGLESLLASPKFLFHPRPQPAGPVENGTALIDEFTLASRLSYFLWSSVPDEELLALVEHDQLRANLPAQVKRMIADPKSSALTANFAGQWLQLRDLANVVPDAAEFPEFDARLAQDMRRESELFFEYILRENRPVLDFLTADYSFVDARLAKLYGLPAPEGDGFQKVSLADTPRRGILTQASILTLTSHPTRTSPVKRGKWLLEHILGEEPPPPPKTVPPLPEAHSNDTISLRTRMEQHRASKACAACHALLDPPGFALENYDPIGRWRATDAKQPVDATGKLITGEKFKDWSELRSLLAQNHPEEFFRCLSEQLLTYALGRGVIYQDKLTVRELAARSAEPSRGFQDLILDIVQSVPFQRMKVEKP